MIDQLYQARGCNPDAPRHLAKLTRIWLVEVPAAIGRLLSLCQDLNFPH